MKYLLLFVCFAATLCSAQNEPAYFRHGNAEVIVDMCRSVTYYNAAEQTIPKEHGYEFGLCTGFIEGVVDDESSNFAIQRTAKQKVQHNECVPDGVTVAQLAKIVVKYADDHPESLNQPAAWFVHMALKKAFPCR